MKTHLDVHCLYRRVTCQYCKEMYLAGEVEVSWEKVIEIWQQYETFVQVNNKVNDVDMVSLLKTMNKFNNTALVKTALLKIGFQCSC